MAEKQQKADKVFKGLTDTEVVCSRKKHGANILTKQKGKSFLRQFISNLNDPVIRILLAALAVNLLLLFKHSDWVESAGIAAAVFLAALISTLSEYSSARAFASLSQSADNAEFRVRRGGKICSVPKSMLVVGDILLLSAGEEIPADGFLLSGELRTDQSAMTGESREVKKLPCSDRRAEPNAKNALFRGSTVTHGEGIMEITAVGDRTALGEISQEIQQDVRESPLKVRLSKLARQISILGYIAAALVAFAYLFNVLVLDSGMRWDVIEYRLSNPSYVFSQLFHAFTLGLTVIVVAVPEGLPMMIAVVLSSNVRRMVKDKVLVRKPVGIEAAGSMNILFTDKTGTLTEGKMRLTGIYLPEGINTTLGGALQQESAPARYISLLCRFGTGATEGVGEQDEAVVLGGSATERALLSAVLSFPAPRGYHITSKLPFDSAKKYSAVTLAGKEEVTLVLGAPEKLLPHAKSAMQSSGGSIPYSPNMTKLILAKQTARGVRVLAAAICHGARANELEHGIPSNLTYLGLLFLFDPLRKEAPRSVAELQDAGIRVVMITGDNRETAAGIARDCGILQDKKDLVLTGEELARLSDHKVKELLPRLAVVARALPTDKSRLVRLSQEMGLVVGMTGDGINDAPALRRADIGFSMGSGTQVAKDAGDIMLLDDNLSTVGRAVLYGRTIFKSIRKFITLQLTMNFCAVGVTMICPFLGIDSPVTVVQMLWINLIMDTLGGLAFAGEAPLPDCMKERPKRRDEPILNRYMVNQIALLGSFTIGLCLFFLKSPTVTAGIRHATDRIYLLTAFFALFIFSSVFNCFNCRTDRLKLFSGLGKNPIFILIMLAIMAVQILFVYLGGSVLRTAPLTLHELSLTMALSLSVFPFEIIRKALWRLRKRKNGY